jgi:hypothetical protein
MHALAALPEVLSATFVMQHKDPSVRRKERIVKQEIPAASWPIRVIRKGME